MLEMTPITIENQTFIAVTLKLPKTNFMAVTSEKGYIMCGALDVALFNENKALLERKIVAGRALGVRTIDQLLEAPLESITKEAEALGVTVGMKGKDALLKMV
ncbi:DUF1805 domain-containing protein [Alkalihalobacillus sp. LMS39]|uniref:YunC family protein n=1 Tax=Alkalihalobacillus sp. LMS39 TaxID=2924032 RepID=UPI001FB2F992|nr:DUF1805 domain-containing protein [Alkalihalobacillus sp. LMS39]UOE96548.1 DUF1805 domain-containing protein [Alkalihalobacillus sp. LMS39]